MINVDRGKLKMSGTPIEIMAELTLVALTLHRDVAEHLGKEVADGIMEDVMFEAIRREIDGGYEDLDPEEETETNYWWD